MPSGTPRVIFGGFSSVRFLLLFDAEESSVFLSSLALFIFAAIRYPFVSYSSRQANLMRVRFVSAVLRSFRPPPATLAKVGNGIMHVRRDDWNMTVRGTATPQPVRGGLLVESYVETSRNKKSVESALPAHSVLAGYTGDICRCHVFFCERNVCSVWSGCRRLDDRRDVTMVLAIM